VQVISESTKTKTTEHKKVENQLESSWNQPGECSKQSTVGRICTRVRVKRWIVWDRNSIV